MGRIVKGPGRAIRVLRDAVVGVSMLALGLLIAARLDDANRQTVTGPFVAIDGDTLAAGHRRLRLEGIDAPEIGQPCDAAGRAVACAEQARLRLAMLAKRGDFLCRGGAKDRYDRLLVRCRSGQDDVNAMLVREGLAVSYGDYRAQEMAARRERIGLWAGPFERPADWRKVHRSDMAGGDEEHSAGLLAFLRDWLGVN